MDEKEGRADGCRFGPPANENAKVREKFRPVGTMPTAGSRQALNECPNAPR
jgi:hypothetical protein